MIKTALILDRESLTAWQLNALVDAAPLIDICVVLSCNNTRQRRFFGRNFLYYVLNAFSLRNRQAVRLRYENSKERLIHFDAIDDGVWQKLPAEVVDELAKEGVKLVIKFGMGLLRIEGALGDMNILSYHHGDPSEFRGRPAGFYEILLGKDSVGTIVQTITNKLDAGRVWAVCHSKVSFHSYKQTSLRFYENSRHLLKKAIVNLANGTPVDLHPSGPIYKLPSNALVLRFALLLGIRKVSRLFYGAFWEKRWNIAVFDRESVIFDAPLQPTQGQVPSVAAGYSFYADPFFSGNGVDIRVEALNSATGHGEIILLARKTLQPIEVLLRGAHYSYPFSWVEGGVEYLAPEIASHSAPMLLRREGRDLVPLPIKGLEKLRILDGTIFKHQDHYYLFGGSTQAAEDCLDLYVSPSLLGEFRPHPGNPVVIDPKRGRMAGRVVRLGDSLVRFGQDNTRQYGNGVTVCEIIKLSPIEYEERVLREIRFDGVSGPHTVDLVPGGAVLDFYVDRFSLLAWYRRLAPRLLKRLWKGPARLR
jgi:hypothetical protein